MGAVIGLTVSCGSGSDDTDPANPADRGSAAPRCDLLDDLQEAEAALVSPAVFDLDGRALGDVLAARRELLEAIAERSSGEVRILLEHQLLSQPAFDQAMLDSWEQDRAELAEAHDDTWMATVLGEEVQLASGEQIRASDFLFYKAMAFERLVIDCRAPELADGPRQETSDDPPEGTLVFFSPGGESEEGAAGQLVSVDPTGGDPRELGSAAPWELVGQLDVVPTSDQGILAGAQQGDEFGTLVLGSAGEVLDVVQQAPNQLVCPMWNGEGTQLVAMDNTADADERRLHLIDPTGRRPSESLELPFAAVSCGDFVTDDRLVVADAALSFEGDRGVWTVGVDGSDPHQLYVADGCTTQVGSVDPTGSRVAVAQTCLDPLASGVWVVDLSTGDADPVATGHAALPKWSPDGEWLVFGFSPLGEGSGIGVWIVRADGRQLREVVEPPAFTPVWLPAA